MQSFIERPERPGILDRSRCLVRRARHPCDARRMKAQLVHPTVALEHERRLAQNGAQVARALLQHGLSDGLEVSREHVERVVSLPEVLQAARQVIEGKL